MTQGVSDYVEPFKSVPGEILFQEGIKMWSH